MSVNFVLAIILEDPLCIHYGPYWDQHTIVYAYILLPICEYESFFLHILAPNTGFHLILQQIWAMFVKKFHISLRAYGFLISQIFIPILFVVFANILVISDLGNTGPQPKRALTLENSALFVDNLSLFYAQLGNISTNNVSEPFLLSVSKYYISYCWYSDSNLIILRSWHHQNLVQKMFMISLGLHNESEKKWRVRTSLWMTVVAIVSRSLISTVPPDPL